MENKEVYIGSVSPTIGVAEQRNLAVLAKQVNPMLTEKEYAAIMATYGEALDRILKENDMEEE